MSTDDLTPLRTASEQSWQEDDAASAMNSNAVRGHEVFAAHAARLASDAADRRSALLRSFGGDA